MLAGTAEFTATVTGVAAVARLDQTLFAAQPSIAAIADHEVTQTLTVRGVLVLLPRTYRSAPWAFATIDLSFPTGTIAFFGLAGCPGRIGGIRQCC
jgi:hypothetical protein